jgi:uncharacterized protein with PQ loop repeat
VNVFEVLGLAGITISVLAYLPQVIHLARKHCSAGVSGRAWTMWLISSLLVGALALHRRDIVFIMLQLSTLTSAGVIVFLVHKYRGMLCEAHAHYRKAGHLTGAPAVGQSGGAEGRLKQFVGDRALAASIRNELVDGTRSQ